LTVECGRIARLALAAGLALCPALCTQASPRPASPADASATIQAAQRQFDGGDYSGAITTLEQALSQSAPSADVYYWLARSYYEVHDYDAAIAQAEKAVSLDPKNSLYHMWLGRAYGGKADRENSFSAARRVKKEFVEAVRLDPSNIAARRDLEEYCLDAPWIVGGSKDEAFEQVNGIAAVDPLEGHLARALFDYSTLKKPELAESEYREVLNARPKRIEPYLEVADFFRRQNRTADLGSTIQAAAQASPGDLRLAFYRGVAGVLDNTNLAGAEKNLKLYLASTPERSDWPAHAAAREWLGRLYELQGKTLEAAEQYRAALQLDPKRKEAKERLDKLGKATQ